MRVPKKGPFSSPSQQFCFFCRSKVCLLEKNRKKLFLFFRVTKYLRWLSIRLIACPSDVKSTQKGLSIIGHQNLIVVRFNMSLMSLTPSFCATKYMSGVTHPVSTEKNLVSILIGVLKNSKKTSVFSGTTVRRNAIWEDDVAFPKYTFQNTRCRFRL